MKKKDFKRYEKKYLQDNDISMEEKKDYLNFKARVTTKSQDEYLLKYCNQKIHKNRNPNKLMEYKRMKKIAIRNLDNNNNALRKKSFFDVLLGF